MIELFYIIIGVAYVFALMVQGWLKATYARWSKVRNSLNLEGASVARNILDTNGMSAVQVRRQTGTLTDHYDPRTKIVSLSDRIFYEPSIASAAVAAHESCHAMQDKLGYGPMRLRYKLVPIAQLAAQFGPWAAIAGVSMGSVTLIQIGFLMFAAAILFQFVTLPIEFDASRRAKKQLQQMGFNTVQDREGARKVLHAAAMTYVAGAATAMGQLVFILLLFARSLFRGKRK